MKECVDYYKTRVHVQNGEEGRRDTVFLRVEPCCDSMRQLWDENHCLLGCYPSHGGIFGSNPRMCLAIGYDSYDGTDYDYQEIRFCPFCAAPCRTQEEMKVKLVYSEVENTTKSTVIKEQEYP